MLVPATRPAGMFTSSEASVIDVRSFKARARGRLRHAVDARRRDVEIRQLHTLVDTYSRPSPPEILIIGDSAMLWVSPLDRDQRTLAGMIGDEVGPDLTVHALAGPGYNARIIKVFLEAVARCEFSPRLVVLPTSHLMATTAWSRHPRFSYVVEAPALRRVAEQNDRSARRLPRSPQEAWEQWDRLPAPSLIGARRTVGEIRLIARAITPPRKGADPSTRWQEAIRLRHLMDLYNAEELNADSPGLRLVREMGECVAGLGLPSVTYVPPLNWEVIARTLGEGAEAHVNKNTEVIDKVYRQAAGDRHVMVDGTFACAATEFGDSVHLGDAGRLHFAQLIADGIRRGLESHG